MKVKVNPLFYALALILTACGYGLNLLCSLLALLFHEGAHMLMARERGYVLKGVTLMPYGAVISTKDNFDKTTNTLVALAGPFANLLLALITLGVWWLFPESYAYTRTFLYANLSLGLFNLLPVFPLDGSRFVLGFCKNKLKAIKCLQWAGVCVSFLLLALFVTSFFFKLNMSLGIMAVFLFYGAVFVAKEESYISVLSATSKNYDLGVEKRCVKISSETPILRFFHHISSTSETVFEIVNEQGKTIKTLCEKDLKDIAREHKLSEKIGSVLGK